MPLLCTVGLVAGCNGVRKKEKVRPVNGVNKNMDWIHLSNFGGEKKFLPFRKEIYDELWILDMSKNLGNTFADYFWKCFEKQ